MIKLIILYLLAVSTAHAQQIAWACKVIDASPSYFDKNETYPALQAEQYAAAQVLGKPNVFPGAGQNPAAWTTRRNSSEAFIHVAFCDSLVVRQVIIAETLHPGTIRDVTGYDYAGNAHDLGSFDPLQMPLPSRTAHVFTEDRKLVLKSIRITFNTSVYGKSIGIDAIGISDSPIPVTLELNLPAALNPKLKTEALSKNVNSLLRELNPVISPDHKHLFFSRAFDAENVGGEHDPEDVWISTRSMDTGEWQPATHMDSVLNTRGPNFVSSIHARHDTTVFLMGNKYGKNDVTAGLTVFLFHNGTWSSPIDLPVEDFYNYSDEGNFFLTVNDSVIVMSVMRDDTYGSRDLYASFRKGNLWTVPMNLGPVINTVGTEATPYLTDDNTMLFFSSEGHSGLGGADIFVSERLDNTWLNWSVPQNLGMNVNSSSDEFGLTLYAGKGHFIRGGKDNTDIIELKAPVLVKRYRSMVTRIHTVTSDNKPLPACKIVITQFSGEHLNTDSTGLLKIATLPNTKYSIEAHHKDYEIAFRDTLFSDEHDITDITLILKPLSQGFDEIMNLEIVYFDFDKSHLKPMFHTYLNRVAEYIIRQRVVVELFGHTDAIGAEHYNHPLSMRRAKAVKEYLVAHGVPDMQVVLYGLGESAPAHANVTASGKDHAEGRKMNRRVEFSLIRVIPD